MPPFSAGAPVVAFAEANGRIANSTKLFWPSSPCQPSLGTEPGSMRPVEPPAVSPAGQSAPAQYRAPGTRSSVGRWAVEDSTVLASAAAISELPQLGGVVVA